jgi:hypothetical protein
MWVFVLVDMTLQIKMITRVSRKFCKQCDRKTGKCGAYTMWAGLTLHVTEMNKGEEKCCLESYICRNWANGYYGMKCLDECPVNFNDNKNVQEKNGR